MIQSVVDRAQAAGSIGGDLVAGRFGGKTKVFGSVTVGHDAVIDGPLNVAGDIKVAMRFHWNKP